MAVVLAMMNVIIAENLYNKEFVEKYTVGFAELAEHVKQYTPEWAEKESEIPASEIYWLAREFAKMLQLQYGIQVEEHLGTPMTSTLEKHVPH